MGINGNGVKILGVRLVMVLLLLGVLWMVVLIRDDFVGVDYSGARSQLAKNFFLNKLIVERQTTKIKATAMQLTFYEPNFDALKRAIKTGEQLTPDSLAKYRDYYEKALQWFPQIPELQGVLGFIYYHLGEKQKSVDFYQRAIRQDPNFFWNHYNLGIILYSEKQYPLAINEFQKALACPFDLNLKFIANSRIFSQIFWPAPNWEGFSVRKSLEGGYHTAQMFLGLSYKMAGHDTEAKKFLNVYSSEMIQNVLNNSFFARFLRIF